MLPLAVFDIDGVLADVRHRLHHVEARPKRWPAFFAAAAADGPLTTGISLLQALQADHEIRYLTGRPERLRRVTEQWLAGNGLPTQPLTMRGNRDFRPSRVYKLEQLTAWLDEGSTIAVVVDDDPQVVGSVSAAGLTVLHATWQDGTEDERRTLQRIQEDLGLS